MKITLPFFRGNKPETDRPEASLLRGAWKRMKKDKLTRVCLWFLYTLIFIAVFSDFIAYSKPYYARYRDKTYFPIVYDYLSSFGLYRWDKELVNTDWRELVTEKSFWPPIRYKPGEPDFRNTQSKSPLGEQKLRNWKERHFLGTDQIGRDVLSGLLHGTRISLTVGLISVGIASFIGAFHGRKLALGQ